MKVDQRTPIDVWPLLRWAYQRQMVQYEFPFGVEPSGYASSWSHMALGVVIDGPSGGGAINAAGTTAHSDAHAVHRCVCLLDPLDARLIISTAATGKPPEWNPDLPPSRVVPVFKGKTGKPRMIYDPRSNRPIACMIDIVGVTDAEMAEIRAEARGTYAHWWKLLRRLRLSLQINGFVLTRWKVAEIGAPRAPWSMPVDASRAAVSAVLSGLRAEVAETG